MNYNKNHFFRRHIPVLDCQPGCHDCCGPVSASSAEMARLPVKSDHTQRPLLCRLLGTTPRLAYPNGKPPETMIDPQQQIYRYFAGTRQVLV